MSRGKRGIKNLMKAAVVSVVALAAVIMAGREQMDVQAAGRPVEIRSCLISGDDVLCMIKANSVPSSDDGKYYIYADEVFEDGPEGEVVATVDAESSVTASFPLNYNTEDSNLSRKFLVAVKRNGQMMQVSDEHYITNPEEVAAFTSARMNTGIKGILLDTTRVLGGELEELGVQQVIYNLSVDELCSGADVPGAISFDYNGRTYYFDNTMVTHYDQLFKLLNEKGLQITVVLLNRGEGAYSQDLVHPMAKEGDVDCPGYALNVADAEGVNHLKAVCAFLGQRYSGRVDCGQVDNWIVGNEVNARTEWWYMNSTSLDVNVNVYVKAFRIMYNEMKGMNANVQIYNSIDQEWNRKSNPGSFLAKEYLDKFNYYMNREGNVDWGLSYHPYNSPLYDPYAWNGPAVWVKQNLSTPYITMQNVDILIDYMHEDKFLNPSGEVRSISLAEIGYTSYFGDSKQEASVAYGYLKAASLPDVDAFMLFRLTDDAHEMESKLSLGIEDINGNKKPAYDIYKNLGTANEAAAKERASEIIGMDIDEMIRDNIVWTRSGDGVVQ
ncbi:MAG: hypothetical protein HFI62_03855 [Lachnospiraceae bacterium]|jgi:hypothetical protein|nr:hypothetical protein [Lachnospiraceae bacterium]